jgi:hypothetical protein
MHRYPHTRYMKYLVCTAAESADHLIDLVRIGGYPAPSRDCAQELMDWYDGLEFARADDDAPAELTDAGYAQLESEGVALFMTDSPVIDEAQRINHNRKARRIIQAICIAEPNLGAAKVSKLVAQLSGHVYAALAIGTYMSMYWDCVNMAASQWKDVYGSDVTAGREAFDICLRRSVEFALWKQGYRIEVDVAEMWRATRHEAFMRFFDTASMKNGMGTAQAAKAWTDIASTADERLADAQPVDEMLSNIFKKLKLRASKFEPRTVDELG